MYLSSNGLRAVSVGRFGGSDRPLIHVQSLGRLLAIGADIEGALVVSKGEIGQIAARALRMLQQKQGGQLGVYDWDTPEALTVIAGGNINLLSGATAIRGHFHGGIGFDEVSNGPAVPSGSLYSDYTGMVRRYNFQRGAHVDGAIYMVPDKADKFPKYPKNRQMVGEGLRVNPEDEPFATPTPYIPGR